MLHIVKTQQAIHSTLLSVANGDDILLIEDAVYLANPKHHLYALLAGYSISVLSADLKARGIAALVAENIQPVDYLGFVELTEQHPNSLTWQ